MACSTGDGRVLSKLRIEHGTPIGEGWVAGACLQIMGGVAYLHSACLSWGFRARASFFFGPSWDDLSPFARVCTDLEATASSTATSSRTTFCAFRSSWAWSLQPQTSTIAPNAFFLCLGHWGRLIQTRFRSRKGGDLTGWAVGF